ncbi:MAG: serpin family protein [Muribaculaceae bacterium]|nr:serpin family protein [Muribaculaceae bacterium]
MKRKILLIFTIAYLLSGMFITSCKNDDEIPDTPAATNPTEQESTKPTDFKIIDLSSSQRQTNAASQNFAYEMLRKCVDQANLQDNNGNLFISPLGFSNILTMLANGADDKTLEEITSVLGADLDDLNSFYSLLADELPKADNQVKFLTANSVWFDYACNPSQNYQDILKKNFAADFFSVNLNSNETLNAINQWCADKTSGMIPTFLKEPLKGSLMFLVNALYFNGKWNEPFDPEKTDKGDFFSSKGLISNVEMMHCNDDIEYCQLSGGELITLYYGNKSFCLNIYLPSDGISIEDALASPDKYLTKAFGNRKCSLSLPKFELEYENHNLKEIAEIMGISRLFNTSGSLSRIDDQLYCNLIKQITKIKVSESGAEAAAVTGSMIQMWDGESAPQDPIEINVNRPFIFSITESTNNIILFAGVIRNL